MEEPEAGADRESFPGGGQRHGDAGQAGEVHGYRVNVVEVHLERIVELFPEAEGGGRGHRGQDDVAGLEGALEVAPDEGADFLRLQVVGVVVAGAQHVGPQGDAALDFGAEAAAAGGAVHLAEVLPAVGAAGSVPDAVVTGEVGRRLGHGDDVVGADAVFRVRRHLQRHVDQPGPVRLHGRCRLLDGGANLRVQSGGEVLPDQADLQTFDPSLQPCRVVGHRLLDRGGVARVVAGDRPQQQGGIADVPGDAADLIERGGVGDQSVAGDAAVGRLDPDDPAVRSRLPNGASRIRSEGGDRFPRRHRRGRTPAAAPGDAAVVDGIAHRSEDGVLARRAHGELVHVGLAEEDGVGGAEPGHRPGVVGGDVVPQYPAGAGGAAAAHADHVLDGNRDACQRPQFLSRRLPAVDPRGRGQGFFGIDRDVGVHHGIDFVDPVEH